MGHYNGFRLLAVVEPSLGTQLKKLDEHDYDTPITPEIQGWLAAHPVYRLIESRQFATAYFEFTEDNHGQPLPPGQRMCSGDQPFVSDEHGVHLDAYFTASLRRLNHHEVTMAAERLAAAMRPPVGVPTAFLMCQYEQDRGLAHDPLNGKDNITRVFYALRKEANGPVIVEEHEVDVDIQSTGFASLPPLKNGNENAG